MCLHIYNLILIIFFTKNRWMQSEMKLRYLSNFRNNLCIWTYLTINQVLIWKNLLAVCQNLGLLFHLHPRIFLQEVTIFSITWYFLRIHKRLISKNSLLLMKNKLKRLLFQTKRLKNKTLKKKIKLRKTINIMQINTSNRL